MKEILKIEHGVPIPEMANRYGKLSAILKQMQVGDSFLYPEKNRNNPMATALRLGMRVASRKAGNNLVRVWRIK